MLPKIDVAQFRNGTDDERRTIAETIASHCETIGFLYAVNHGIAPETIAAVQTATRQFFALPAAQKRIVERPRGRYRGYIPVSHFAEDAEGQPLVLYEAFLQGMPLEAGDERITGTQGLLAPNIWPDETAVPGFRKAAEDYWNAVDRLSLDLLEAFSMALGLPHDALVHRFTSQLTNISYLHYQPRPALDKNAAQPEPRAHADTNALTILLPDPVGGLEVLMKGNTWAEVDPLEGTFTINIGNMMEAWSGGRFKSTMHRVNPPPGVERYSIGFFAVPDYDTVIEPIGNAATAGAGDTSDPLHVGNSLASFVASCDTMQAA
jgi:isopenicillin N synthase-like dioxygenase